MSELVLMCGVPRSGKSTFARDLQTTGNHLIVCPDQLRSLVFGHVFRKELEPLVWFLAEAIIRVALSQGHSVILDATNTHAKAITKWRDVAAEFDSRCRVVVVNTDIEMIRDRNTGPGAVPDHVLDRMLDQFERFKRDILPQLEEDKAIVVDKIVGLS